MDFQPKTIVVQIISYHCPVQKVETFFIGLEVLSDRELTTTIT